jgi:hypothetical protein
MELFFTDRRGALAREGVPGIDSAEVHALFERRLVLDGMPVLSRRTRAAAFMPPPARIPHPSGQPNPSTSIT